MKERKGKEERSEPPMALLCGETNQEARIFWMEKDERLSQLRGPSSHRA